MHNLQEASRLVNDGVFDKDKWIDVYTYTSQHHEWDALMKSRIIGKPIEFLKEYNNLQGEEQFTEKNFPITDGLVLELGAHYGRFAIYKTLTSNVIIEAIDASKVIIDITIEHEAKLGLSDRIHRHLMLAEELEFEDNTFDRVYAFETMEHVGDLNKSLLEVRRVLKPNGDFVFSLPFHHHADSGFHTQKHSKEYWIEKLSKYFVVDKIIDTQKNMAMIGKVIKDESLS